jgi:mRNA-degrading endonuclease YafQ of YafQ-DinJ toxin-antitoxin module
MSSLYQVLSTSRFARDYKALAKRNPQVISQVEAMVGILQQDPYNRSGRHRMKRGSGASLWGTTGFATTSLGKM